VALLLEVKLLSVNKTADGCAKYNVKNKVFLLQIEAIRARESCLGGVCEVGSRIYSDFVMMYSLQQRSPLVSWSMFVDIFARLLMQGFIPVSCPK
jgi:hypothetical protein